MRDHLLTLSFCLGSAALAHVPLVPPPPLYVPIDHKGQVVNNALAFFEEHGQTARTDGDAAADVLYASYGSRLHLFLRRQNILSFVTYTPKPTQVHQRWDVQLTGELVNPNAVATPVEVVNWTHNYYLPTCPNGATGVHGYRRIVYRDVYPSTDMHVYSNAWGYKFYFVVRPGGDPDNILLSFQGPDSLKVDELGALKGYLGQTEFRFPHAIAYQEVAGQTTLVPWAIDYHESLDDHLVNFTFGTFDHTQPLIIDISESFGPLGEERDSPIPEWGTYYGGGDYEEVSRMSTGYNGGIAACGKTWSANFPVTVGPSFDPEPGQSDAYMTAFNTDYSREFTTFYGGDRDDGFEGVCFGYNGHFVAAGRTHSDELLISGPTGSFVDGSGPLDFTKSEVVIAEFNLLGVREWSTYFGPDQVILGLDPTRAVANVGVDHNGKLVVAGNINQNYGSGWSNPYLLCEYTDQPTEGTMPICGGGYQQDFMPYANFIHEGPIPAYHDGYVIKFNPARQLVYSTLFGGSSANEAINDMAVDVNSDVYLIGTTFSPQSSGCAAPPSGDPGFPWCAFTGGYNQVAAPEAGLWQEGNQRAFVACLQANNNLSWCTSFGMPGAAYWTQGVAIALSKAGSSRFVDIVGNTNAFANGPTPCEPPAYGFPVCNSTGYPFTFPWISNPSSERGFIARFDASTKALLWSSSLGACTVTDVNSSGNKVYVAATRHYIALGAQPLMDAVGYYTDLDPASVGEGLILGFNGDQFYGSCYGGDQEEVITSIVAGTDERIFVGGYTNSGSLFPLNDPYPGLSWYVDALQPDGSDLFYGQVKVVEQPVAISTAPEPAQGGLLVVPSPAIDQVRIICAKDLCDRAGQVVLYDAQGGLVIRLAATGSTTHMNVSSLSAGIYTVHLLDAQGIPLASATLIKNR